MIMIFDSRIILAGISRIRTPAEVNSHARSITARLLFCLDQYFAVTVRCGFGDP